MRMVYMDWILDTEHQGNGMMNTNSAKSCQETLKCKEYRGRGPFKKYMLIL